MNLPTKLDIYFKRWGNRSNDCFRIYLYSRVFTICNHEMRPWSIDFWQGNRTYKCYWQNQSFDKKNQHSNYRQKIQFLSNPARMSKRNLHVTLCSVLRTTWDNSPPLKAAKQSCRGNNSSALTELGIFSQGCSTSLHPGRVVWHVMVLYWTD